MKICDLRVAETGFHPACNGVFGEWRAQNIHVAHNGAREGLERCVIALDCQGKKTTNRFEL